VQHPLLDKVRQCSAHPEQAARFFQKVLCPIPHTRAEAIHDVWCADAVNRMFTETGTSYKALGVEADLQPDAKRQAGLCAAWFGCFGCAGRQRSQHTSDRLLSKTQKTKGNAASRFPFSRMSRQAAAEMARSQQSGSQADKHQKAPPLPMRKGCLSSIKCALTGMSKRGGQHAAQEAGLKSATEAPMYGDGNKSHAALDSSPCCSVDEQSTQPLDASFSKHRLLVGDVSLTAMSDLESQLTQHALHSQVDGVEVTRTDPQTGLGNLAVDAEQTACAQPGAACTEAGQKVAVKADQHSAADVDRCDMVCIVNRRIPAAHGPYPGTHAYTCCLCLDARCSRYSVLVVMQGPCFIAALPSTSERCMQRCSKQYLFHMLWECFAQGQHRTQWSQRLPTQGPSEASTQIIIMSRSLLIS